MALHFNIEEMVRDFEKKLRYSLEIRLDNWEQDTIKEMRSEIAQKFDAEVRAGVEKKINKVIAYLKANPAALADSFGTGSLIDESNPYLNEYFSSKNINPLRKDKRIYGRPAGRYINILDGKPRTSSGKFAGDPIEHIAKPSSPTHSIQTATNFFCRTQVPIAIKEAVRELKLSKYITEDNAKWV